MCRSQKSTAHVRGKSVAASVNRQRQPRGTPPGTGGESMTPEPQRSSTSAPDGLRVVYDLIGDDPDASFAAYDLLIDRVICQQLAGVRQSQPEGKSSSQDGSCSSGVVGTAQLSQPNVPDTSANSHGPSERMDLVTALFLDA